MYTCKSTYEYYAHLFHKPSVVWQLLPKADRQFWASEAQVKHWQVSNKLHAKYLTWYNKTYLMPIDYANAAATLFKPAKKPYNLKTLKYINRTT